MRRLIPVAAVSLCLAACGAPSPREDAIAHREAVVEAPAAPGSADAANWQRFADNVKVWASGYTVTLRLGPDAGTPEGRLAALQAGTVQVAALEPAAAARLVPELAVLSAPQLFDTQAEADHILDKVLLDRFQPLFRQKGLQLLGWYDDDWADPSVRAVYRAGVIVADNAWFERLPPQDRDIFRQAYGSAGEARKASRAARRSQLSLPATAPSPPAAGEVNRLQQQAVARAGGKAQQIYDAILEARAAYVASQEAPAAAVPADPGR